MKRVFPLFLLLLCPIVAAARVISYAPYSDQLSIRGYHERTTRYFVLVEAAAGNVADEYVQNGTVVLYDSTGAEPPRVIHGPDTIFAVALYERRATEAPTVLVITATRTLVSRNGGRSWRQIAELDKFELLEKRDIDRGGPWTQGMAVPVLIGSGRYPFVVSYDEGVYAISATGAPKLLVSDGTLLGQNLERTQFLLVTNGRVVVTDFKGRWRTIGPVVPYFQTSGWIAPNGDVYIVEGYGRDGVLVLRYPAGGGDAMVVGKDEVTFAIPTHDFNGAWLLTWEQNRSTTLERYRPSDGLKTMWEDEDAPEVEALHAGASGDTLLIQVHRERAQHETPFLDPALAIWRVGQPAPAEYDELFLNEGPGKGFVHLDVDKAAAGQPFVFDSSFVRPRPPDIVVSPPISGAIDVIQEWGVVRASLEQRLVIQGVTNEVQVTDLVIYNPLDVEQSVVLELGEQKTTITLEPNEIEIYADVLTQLFDFTGTGTLHLLPEAGVNAFGHVHAAAGRHGHVVQAVDFMNSASPRFPVTFSAARDGAQLIVSDTSGQGIDADTADLRMIKPRRGSLIAAMQVADEKTGDTMYFTPDLPASAIRTLPILAHEDGKLLSDLYLFNFSPLDRRITIEIVPYESGGGTRLQTYFLKPYETRVFEDALKSIFGLTGFARMRYWSPGAQGDATGVRVASRLYKPAANGGTYGTALPPLNSFQSVTGDESLEIHGLRSGYRASLGLVELSPNPRDFYAAARVSIYDQFGTLIDRFDQSFRRAGGVLIDDLFKGKPQPAVARVVIEPYGDWALIGAYALLTDPTTGDPTYLGAQLGATPK